MMKKIVGFSIIELVVVIAIIAILSVNVLITYQPAPINLAAQANQLADDIRYTQSLAMTKGVRYRIVFTTPNKYQILNASGTATILALGNTTLTMGTGVTIGSMTNLPSSLINFDGMGNPYSDTATPGTALAATATIPLTAGGITMTVAVTPGTGRVVVQ